VIFILHLQIVLLIDGALKIKVPHDLPCYRTVTMKVLRLLTSFITLFVLGGCAIRGNIPTQVGLQLVVEGFTSPVALIDPADGTPRLFVVDQVGVIWIISEGKRIEKPFLDLHAHVVELNSFYEERGLLGLAFHPDFATNGRFYVSYSAPLQAGLSPDEWDHTTLVSEFTVSEDDPNQADPSSERILLAMDKPGYNYEAGHIAFGPDGYLYIATGDSVRDPGIEVGRFAQDTSSLLGKVLRIDVNGTAGTGQNYLIPADNPFVSGSGRPEIFAYGFRNPYRFSFDVADQRTRLFVADVGQAMMEEVNLVEPGGNYGWPVREGTTCFNLQAWNRPLETCSTHGLSEPVIVYTHQGDLSAIIGGVIYRGKAFPDLDGRYIFGDWGRGNGHLFVAYPPILGSGLWKIMEIQVEIRGNQSGVGQLLGIGYDENGEIYLLTKEPGTGPTGNSGRVYKVVPADQ
jgi:glucose/arabinose dehydrogenase